jgi:hypothetical protein
MQGLDLRLPVDLAIVEGLLDPAGSGPASIRAAYESDSITQSL